MVGLGTVTKAMAAVSAALLLSFFIGLAPGPAVDFPQAKISNGQLTMKIYLPDARNGYYRSTRFDWSGAIYSLQYKDHDFMEGGSIGSIPRSLTGCIVGRRSYPGCAWRIANE